MGFCWDIAFCARDDEKLDGSWLDFALVPKAVMSGNDVWEEGSFEISKKLRKLILK